MPHNSTPQQHLPRRAYSINETAEILRIHPRTLYRLVYTEQVASVRIGGRRIIRADEVERLLQEGTVS